MIDVITTFNEAGYNSYAKRMIESFDQYWPKGYNLHIYAENCNISLNVSDRIKIYDLHNSFPDLVQFKEKHKNNPHANGSKMKDGTLNYNQNHFKWDAVRFSNKVFVVTNCALTMDSDTLVWLDADTITFTAPSDKILEEVLPDSTQYCSYLGRQGKYHSECGWVAYNLKHRVNRDFMGYWKNLYIKPESGLFKLREYHDSYVFDVVRQKFEQEGKCINKNITPIVEGRKGPGHPFIASKLGTFMDHVKGKRKLDGHSRKEEVHHKDLDYWKGVLNNV